MMIVFVKNQVYWKHGQAKFTWRRYGKSVRKLCTIQVYGKCIRVACIEKFYEKVYGKYVPERVREGARGNVREGCRGDKLFDLQCHPNTILCAIPRTIPCAIPHAIPYTIPWCERAAGRAGAVGAYRLSQVFQWDDSNPNIGGFVFDLNCVWHRTPSLTQYLAPQFVKFLVIFFVLNWYINGGGSLLLLAWCIVCDILICCMRSPKIQLNIQRVLVIGLMSLYFDM